MQKITLAISILVGLAAAGPCLAEDLLEIYDLAVQSDPLLKEAEQKVEVLLKSAGGEEALEEFDVGEDDD